MVTIRVLDGDNEKLIQAEKGETLLSALKKNEVNIYGALSSKINCGGRGICATCGVYILSDDIQPIHWHDQLASTFGYPRLSCQIKIVDDMTIRKPTGKVMWGQLFPKRK